MRHVAEGHFVGGCKIRTGQRVFFKYVVPVGATYRVWTITGIFLNFFRTIGGNEYIIIDVSSIDDSGELGGRRIFRVADIPVNNFILLNEEGAAHE